MAVKTGIFVGMGVFEGRKDGTTEEVGVTIEVLVAVDLSRLPDGKQAVRNNTKMRVA